MMITGYASSLKTAVGFAQGHLKSLRIHPKLEDRYPVRIEMPLETLSEYKVSFWEDGSIELHREDGST